MKRSNNAAQFECQNVCVAFKILNEFAVAFYMFEWVCEVFAVAFNIQEELHSSIKHFRMHWNVVHEVHFRLQGYSRKYFAVNLFPKFPMKLSEEKTCFHPYFTYSLPLQSKLLALT